MKAKISQILTKLTIFLLFIFWILSVYQYLKDEDFSLTSLDGRYSAGTLKFSSSSEMIAGDFISGEFKSKYDNLGTILVRFKTFKRINDDVLTFRMKESVSNDWYYEAEYKTDQFQDGKLFPFGFPLIIDSEGKTYSFEIRSNNGEKENSVGLNGNFPSFVSKHVFTKEFLLSKPSSLVYFLVNKFIGIFGDRGVLLAAFNYSLPLIYFLIFTLFGYSPMIPILVIFLSIVVDLIVGASPHRFFSIAIGFAWILPVFKFKIHHKVSSILGLAFLGFMALSWIFKEAALAEKLAIYALILFITAAAQQIYALYWKVETISPKAFWKRMFLEFRNTLKFIYFVARGDIVVTAGQIKAKHSPGKKLLAIIIYRLEAPMFKTYLVFSKLTTLSIILLVKTLKLGYRYGPLLIFILMVLVNLTKTQSYLHFYQDFYPVDQNNIFWKSLGKYLVFVSIILIVLYFIKQHRHKLREKLILASLLLILYFQTSIILFNSATSYKYDIIIWSISPKKATLWDEVRITGRNFREMPFEGEVYIDGIEHRVLSWSDREIIFQADPTKTKTGEVKIVDYYGKESGTIHLDYYDLQTNQLIK